MAQCCGRGWLSAALAAAVIAASATPAASRTVPHLPAQNVAAEGPARIAPPAPMLDDDAITGGPPVTGAPAADAALAGNGAGIDSPGAIPGTTPGASRHDGHYDGNFLVVAAGVALVPDYEGSPRSSPTEAAGIMGRIGPVSFSPRAAGLAFNLSPIRVGRHFEFSAGPVFRHQSNRHGNLSDPAVAVLGSLPATWELGWNASVAWHRLITAADALSLGVDMRWDVSGNGAGRIVTTSLGYYSPVSRGVLVGASAFADFADDRFAQYNYAISPTGSLASGLPVYRAHGGNRALGAQAAVVLDLDGDLLDGGFAVLVGINWSRLQGSAADTPITALRGQRSQLSYAAGLGYSF